MPGLTQLVLVPGHAVWSLQGDPADSRSWHLKPFQNGEPGYFIEHIRAGITHAANDPKALLMFSGGATEKSAGPVTEALGYWKIAEHYRWWGETSIAERTVIEEFALDSFLNVQYGLHRFRQVAGAWPDRITVCGWGFKGRRIQVLHRDALGWTRPFDYLNVNEPPNLEEVRSREAETCRQFEADPRGESAPIAEKRRQRDHWHRVPPYDLLDESWRSQ